MKMHQALVFMGPQGSGKGTQATSLAKKYGYQVIATGDLFRAEANKGTELGRKIGQLIEAGTLVPDKLTVELLQQTLQRMPAEAIIIFDGFPRNSAQATILDTLVRVTRAVNITLPSDVSIKRIAGRLMCPNGHTYNTYFVPPQRQGLCDVDDLPLHSRKDDTEDAVTRRLALYQKMTTPVLDFYREQNKLVIINGDASVDEVFRDIEKHVISVL